MSTTALRYQLPKRAVKGHCPQCGPHHQRTLSRYLDTRTGDLLPADYGRCDRENNCTYHLSPYHKGPSGMSYADLVFEQFKIDNTFHRRKPVGSFARPTALQASTTIIRAAEVAVTPKTIYTIPENVFKRSLGHYNKNQFATLLRNHFGNDQAAALLSRFCIGTSSYWPDATIFWLVDTDGRALSGQLVLFAEDWHRAKYTDQKGNLRACISSVSHGLLRHYRIQGEDVPDWLSEYHEHAPRWPVPFGLHQLRDAPADQPVAIVEACKTAVICAGYFPQFVWLAIGAKSYPNAERLSMLRNRPIVLYPDLNAYTDWSKRAEAMNAEGFRINVSDYLERYANDQQKQQGLDLADFLLAAPVVDQSTQPLTPSNEPLIVKTLTDWSANPGSILQPCTNQLTYL
ncbi:DUF6371 domain-containing protein [Fibrivirga algicola]|uniref:Uncharacterized protein n=1 Tax=Fibrivirga algicola TaxID=2950420 RepID=A0ABX0QEN9_9BACT|nr:DUF6371 domain-containing protein [Fibrivirga algicola]NID10636.1 hypothetical protein [Fibrivirga algicola]